jgi:hypothetical protein
MDEEAPRITAVDEIEGGDGVNVPSRGGQLLLTIRRPVSSADK